MKSVLTISHLTKRFKHVTAVQDLSFSIKKGYVYGILGPNGSGKSTTLGMVLNVVNKTQGDFLWFDGNKSTHEALKQVGAIIEHPSFYPYMTAYQNLKLVCKIKEIPYDQIADKLKTVGLLKRKNDLFKTFSLGMKQRLAIASALLNDPAILILDEPTNGLDPQGIHQIREIIKNIASQGTTILLASHLLDEVEKVCTHVLVLQNGAKLYAGRVDALTSGHGFFELKSDDSQRLYDFLKTDDHFKSVTMDANDLITAFLAKPLQASTLNTMLFEQGITLSHLAQRKNSLEEQFLELTNHH